MGIEFSVVFSLIAGVLAAVSSVVFAWGQARRHKKRAPTLEETINTLAKNLEVASASISQIENEISKRREMAHKLKEDVARYQQLRELSQTQVEAVAQTLRGEVATEARRSRYINAAITFVIAFAFFLAGFFAGRL